MDLQTMRDWIWAERVWFFPIVVAVLIAVVTGWIALVRNSPSFDIDGVVQRETRAELDEARKGKISRLEVRTIDTTITPNADGTYTNSRLVEIISRCPPGMLRFIAHGKNIISYLRIKKTNQIMMLTGAGGRIGDSVFLEVENAWGKYMLIVNTRNGDDVIFDYSCK